MTTDPRDNAPLTPDEQYLWDGRAQPDPATTRVESALAQLRYQGQLRAPAPRRALRPYAVAAALLLTGMGGYLLLNRTPPGAPAPTWTIASTGDVRIGEPRQMKSTVTLRDIIVGEGGRVSLTAGRSSTIQIEGAAQLQVADGTDQFPWLTLSKGHAFAQVAHNDNPIMLGLHAHSLTLQPGSAASIATTPDSTQLTCKAGEAHIDWPHEPTRVLGPASCTIDAQNGPELPMPAFASKEACGVIEKLEDTLPAMMKDPKGAESFLIAYLEQSKPADAPILWNLLYRVPLDFRRPVRDALYRHITPPKLNPDLLLKLDPAAMDAAWTAAVQAARQQPPP